MSEKQANLPSLQKILLIDDDPDDCYLFTDAIKSQFTSIDLSLINNVQLVPDYLQAKLPDLIFLDLNMPFKNGFEFLSDLKSDVRFSHIPVVIFSSSNYSKDIKLAYEQGAALYLVKPVSFEELSQALQQIILLDWKKPAVITAEHYIDGSYQPFSLHSTH